MTLIRYGVRIDLSLINTGGCSSCGTAKSVILQARVDFGSWFKPKTQNKEEFLAQLNNQHNREDVLTYLGTQKPK